MTKVLGFDVSSTCIGWGLLSVDGYNVSYIDSGYFKPPKTGDLISRIYKTKEAILDIITKFDPDEIAIEDIVQFMKGKSTAQTIIMLTTFNRMICLLSRDFLGKSPTLHNVMTIRHGLKINKKLPKKEDMPGLVSQHLGITFPYKFNKLGAKKIENYDEADGIAVSLYRSFLLSGKIKKKVAKKTVKKKASKVKK